MDVHVGARVRVRRKSLGLSQQRLAAALGITWQQVQKYERGANRITASRLWDIGVVLDVPLSFFFDEAPVAGRTGRFAVTDPMRFPEMFALVAAFHRISEPTVHGALLRLIRAAGRSEMPDSAGDRSAPE